MNRSPLNNEVSYPLSQPTWLRFVAKILSYIFHPLFIPFYLAAYVIYVHPYAFAMLDEKQKLIRLISIFVITAFFPAVTVLLLWRLKFSNSIFLRTQKERIIPYVTSVIYFFWAFYVSKNFPGSPLVITFLFLGIFLSTSAALMANSYFKISLHALGVGGAAAYVILLSIASMQPMGLPIVLTTLLAGLVCTARLIISDHRPKDIYWGLIIGGISQWIAYLVIV